MSRRDSPPPSYEEVVRVAITARPKLPTSFPPIPSHEPTTSIEIVAYSRDEDIYIDNEPWCYDSECCYSAEAAPMIVCEKFLIVTLLIICLAFITFGLSDDARKYLDNH